jgi:hypothetical protein
MLTRDKRLSNSRSLQIISMARVGGDGSVLGGGLYLEPRRAGVADDDALASVPIASSDMLDFVALDELALDRCLGHVVLLDLMPHHTSTPYAVNTESGYLLC